jgi:hypothetical protein
MRFLPNLTIPCILGASPHLQSCRAQASNMRRCCVRISPRLSWFEGSLSLFARVAHRGAAVGCGALRSLLALGDPPCSQYTAVHPVSQDAHMIPSRDLRRDGREEALSAKSQHCDADVRWGFLLRCAPPQDPLRGHRYAVGRLVRRSCTCNAMVSRRFLLR